MRPRAQYAHKTVGWLTVLGEVHQEPPKSHRYWICTCRCGKPTIVRQDALATGNTRSCGCKRRHPSTPAEP